MTSLQGYVLTTYDKLVSVFGNPNRGDDKSSVEWQVALGNNEFIYIYDWKEYDEEDDENTEERNLITPMGMYHWHIGGKSKIDVSTIKIMLEDA